MRILHADDSSLAQHLAVLLPGDFFRHLEDHLHQGFFGKAFPSQQQHSRLAEVLDRTLAPCPQVIHPVARWRIHLASSPPRPPPWSPRPPTPPRRRTTS